MNLRDKGGRKIAMKCVCRGTWHREVTVVSCVSKAVSHSVLSQVSNTAQALQSNNPRLKAQKGN